jgi:hypothetical protein
MVAEALDADPADQIARTIAQVIDEVIGGKRPCPHHVRDLGM